jgi:hypothetical protein
MKIIYEALVESFSQGKLMSFNPSAGEAGVQH